MVMASVEIRSEREMPNGWLFEAESVVDSSSERHRHELQLSWADYNHWSVDGADPPQRVAEAVVRFLLSRLDPDVLPKRFDAATARRRFSDADQEIPKLIRR